MSKRICRAEDDQPCDAPEACSKSHSADAECEHPWCVDEPFHTVAEHMDPPDRDPNSDLYREVEQKVNEAMGDLGWLLDTAG